MMAMADASPRSRDFLTRLSRLTGAEATLLAEAMLVLAFGSAAIRLLPFARVGKLASGPLGRRRPRQVDELAAKVAWAVRACARRAPWRAVCFQQGLALSLIHI